MTKVQPFDAILHQQTTTIATDDATTTTTSSSSQVDQVSFIRSIKFTLILMISILLVLSVIVLSAIWLEISMSSEDIKQQFIGDGLDIYNLNVVEKKTYSGYKSGQKLHNGIVISSYVGDMYNFCFGFITWSNGHALFNITSEDQKIYSCALPLSQYDYCQRKSTPDQVMSSFDLSVIIQSCMAHPNNLTFTPSYADPAMPQYTFISLINCVEETNPTLLANGKKFSYYYGNDLTTGSISEFLKKRTEELVGSRSFIIETCSNFVIAVDNDAILSTWGTGNTLIRKTYETIEDATVVSLSRSALTNLGKTWKELACNQILVTLDASSYISVYRLCTVTNIDWIIVLAVPQWNYIGSTVIAIVASVLGSIMMVSFGVLVGILFSIKIVRPIYNLLDLFESVSNMNLDGLDVLPSHFSEVKLLQLQFLSMVKRMKLYKSFIPAHLLSEIEEQQIMDPITNQQPLTHQQYKVGDANNSSMSQSQSSVEESHSKNSSSMNAQNIHRNSSKKKHSKDVNKFSLYLESKRVTMIQILYEGFNDLLHSMSPQETVSLLSDVFEQVNSCSRTHGAVQISLENDSITLALNATQKQQNHEEKGAHLCRSLNEKLLSLKLMRWIEFLKKRPHLADLLCFRFAVLSQECFCGNLGTKEVKQFSLLSSGKHNLQTLLNVSKQMNISIVCSESVRNSCVKSFQTRFIESMCFIDDTFVSTLQDSPKKETNIYEIGMSLQTQHDELMYELASQEKANVWNHYNQACQYYFEKNYSQALELFQNFYSKNSNDKPTENMIHKCQTFM
ncbi:hypothetical protein FDP41_001066 [Naegleria fowleri]|uniref:Guanylate cyclase domain-containing protein n=1 Tax=Naegleria fowleri TaxID=5763 RepID=A0A6A5BPG3_NAEFO|nr:uncharacterized protein FDP41_001066 [Naegleria fowleri]KAF0979913.1 hypothetical protein FDP41_001066 [Naegleria fowleri]